MKPKHAAILALFLALLMESTYELMSKYESWMIGLALGAISGFFIVSAIKSSRNR